MADTMTITIACAPGQLTPEFAVECQGMVRDLLQAIADDIKPGGITFAPRSLEWVDDGKDEIVIHVSVGAPT